METPKTRQERWAFIVKMAIQKQGCSSVSAFSGIVGKSPSTLGRWIMSKNEGVDPSTIDLGDVKPVLDCAEITLDQFWHYMETGEFDASKTEPQPTQG